MFSSPLARIVALTLILAGCGTKGPLTLPPKDTSRPPSSAAPAAVQPDNNKVKTQ